jgi:hypothetical protein
VCPELCGKFRQMTEIRNTLNDLDADQEHTRSPKHGVVRKRYDRLDNGYVVIPRLDDNPVRRCFGRPYFVR